MNYINDKVACKRAAGYIVDGVTWEKTPEGTGFWSALHQRLCHMGVGTELTDPLWRPPSAEPLTRQIALLQERVDQQQRELTSQADTINALRRKLLISDFCNMGR